MSFGIWELGIILAIVALLFGTKKLRTIGADMGSAIKGFRSAMKDEETNGAEAPAEGRVIEGEVQPPTKNSTERAPGTS